MLQSLQDRRLHAPRRDTDVVPMAAISDMEEHILKLTYLSHTCAAEELIWNPIRPFVTYLFRS